MTRVVDIAIAGVATVMLSPLLLVVAVLVRIDSRGPVLFRQQRVGKGGAPFEILKFRTMADRSELTPGPQVTTANDPRITRVGRLLRSAKLDELPQLFNVLRGDMCLVGPRPEVPHYAAFWTDEQRATILSIRPGITDPASLAFRRESELLAKQSDPEGYYVAVLLPRKAEMYVRYVRERSLWVDLRILMLTVRAVVVR